jgi:hypothetical protein
MSVDTAGPEGRNRPRPSIGSPAFNTVPYRYGLGVRVGLARDRELVGEGVVGGVGFEVGL